MSKWSLSRRKQEPLGPSHRPNQNLLVRLESSLRSLKKQLGSTLVFVVRSMGRVLGCANRGRGYPQAQWSGWMGDQEGRQQRGDLLRSGW